MDRCSTTKTIETTSSKNRHPFKPLAWGQKSQPKSNIRRCPDGIDQSAPASALSTGRTAGDPGTEGCSRMDAGADDPRPPILRSVGSRCAPSARASGDAAPQDRVLKDQSTDSLYRFRCSTSVRPASRELTYVHADFPGPAHQLSLLPMNALVMNETVS